MRPRSGRLRSTYSVRTRLGIQSELCSSLTASGTHRSHLVSARPPLFSPASTTTSTPSGIGLIERSWLCRAPNMPAEPIRNESLLEKNQFISVPAELRSALYRRAADGWQKSHEALVELYGLIPVLLAYIAHLFFLHFGLSWCFRDNM